MPVCVSACALLEMTQGALGPSHLMAVKCLDVNMSNSLKDKVTWIKEIDWFFFSKSYF